VVKQNSKPKKQLDKWHVFQLGGNYYVLSDSELAKMDTQQRAAYTPVQRGFDTNDAAFLHMANIGGKGVKVEKPRTD